MMYEDEMEKPLRTRVGYNEEYIRPIATLTYNKKWGKRPYGFVDSRDLVREMTEGKKGSLFKPFLSRTSAEGRNWTTDVSI